MGWRLWRREANNRDLDEEIAYDLAAEAADRAQGGMAPEQAQSSSRKDFGNVLRVKEETRATWGWSGLERSIQDARFAMRQLRRSPGFAAVAILSLGLGIGGNTAVFTLINLVMLKSLPVSHAEELVWLTRAGEKRAGFSQPLWEQIRDYQDMFAALFAYAATRVDLSAGGEARRMPVGLVSGGFFSTLGVLPAAGRTLAASDDRPGCPAIAVISHGFWQSEYGGDANAVDRTLTLDGRPFQIVGVTRPGFFGIEIGYHVPIWVPVCTEVILGREKELGYNVIGRRPPEFSLEQIRSRFQALAPALLEATIPPHATPEDTALYRKSTFGVVPFSQGLPDLRANIGEMLLVLMAIIGVVLLIACGNIANLLMARATARQREIAVRMALGASRGRLIRQLLTESLVLSLAGAALGFLFAHWGSRILVGFLSRKGNVVSLDLSPDGNVLLFTLAAGVLTGLLFGLAPAWRAVMIDPHVSIKASGRGIGGGRFAAGKVLVVAQIAFSLVSIVSAGLLLGTWRRLATIDPGFQGGGVLLASANLATAGLSGGPWGRGQTTDGQLAGLYRRTLERLRAIPGVTAASTAVRTPIGNTNWNTTIDIEGIAPSKTEVRVRLNEVSEGYFATIRTPLLAGRDFGNADLPASPAVVIVSDELARKFFGGASAIGRRFQFHPSGPAMEIIGIAGNAKEFDLREENQPVVYLASRQSTKPFPSITFALRTKGPPLALAPAVKAAIAEIDPHFTLDLVTLQEQVDESVKIPRTLGLLSGFFGALALLLASMGLYGIVSYMVSRRRSEIGVRIALGAEPSHILRMVFQDVGRLVAAGITMGALLSVPAARLLTHFLYGVHPSDPATLTASALTLAVVAVGAALMPARRAARLDAVAALREQ